MLLLHPLNRYKVYPLFNFGALDERFSLRSAKPARAVRLRHAPQRKRNSIMSSFFVCPNINVFITPIFYSAGCNSAYSVLQEKQGQAFLTPGSSLCPTMRASGYSARRSFSSDKRATFCISVRVSAGRPFSSRPPS